LAGALAAGLAAGLTGFTGAFALGAGLASVFAFGAGLAGAFALALAFDAGFAGAFAFAAGLAAGFLVLVVGIYKRLFSLLLSVSTHYRQSHHPLAPNLIKIKRKWLN
jgi:hypothetical protein